MKPGNDLVDHRLRRFEYVVLNLGTINVVSLSLRDLLFSKFYPHGLL